MWKPTELLTVLQSLEQNTQPVEDYIFLLKNMDYLIRERAFVKVRLMQKVGITVIQSKSRRQSEKQGFRTWKPEEVKRIMEFL